MPYFTCMLRMASRLAAPTSTRLSCRRRSRACVEAAGLLRPAKAEHFDRTVALVEQGAAGETRREVGYAVVV